MKCLPYITNPRYHFCTIFTIIYPWDHRTGTINIPNTNPVSKLCPISISSWHFTYNFISSEIYANVNGIWEISKLCLNPMLLIANVFYTLRYCFHSAQRPGYLPFTSSKNVLYSFKVIRQLCFDRLFYSAGCQKIKSYTEETLDRFREQHLIDTCSTLIYLQLIPYILLIIAPIRTPSSRV